MIPTDVGRPLTDLHPMASDTGIASDARLVLGTLEPIDREIQTQSGAWFIRRILPYRTQEGRVEGVVITSRTSARSSGIRKALEEAKLEASRRTEPSRASCSGGQP